MAKKESKKTEEHVIFLDSEELEYPNRVKVEKLKIIKKIAATGDLKKLEELKQFDEDKTISANEWDDLTVSAATDEAFFDGMEVGEREGLVEGIELAERTQQRVRGKKGGEKSKKNKPILMAVIEYLKENQKLVGKTNDQIARNFKRNVKRENPLSIKFNGLKWTIFCDESIWSIPDRPNSKYKSKTISYETFIKRYIPEAKKSIKTTQAK
jgi:hypothetical protein